MAQTAACAAAQPAVLRVQHRRARSGPSASALRLPQRLPTQPQPQAAEPYGLLSLRRASALRQASHHCRRLVATPAGPPAQDSTIGNGSSSGNGATHANGNGVAHANGTAHTNGNGSTKGSGRIYTKVVEALPAATQNVVQQLVGDPAKEADRKFLRTVRGMGGMGGCVLLGWAGGWVGGAGVGDCGVAGRRGRVCPCIPRRLRRPQLSSSHCEPRPCPHLPLSTHPPHQLFSPPAGL